MLASNWRSVSATVMTGCRGGVITEVRPRLDHAHRSQGDAQDHTVQLDLFVYELLHDCPKSVFSATLSSIVQVLRGHHKVQSIFIYLYILNPKKSYPY
jgi:hypothetical protein